ncbi:MAG: glycyl-radical enzyme activating protein [Bacteroidota bacterium]
MNMTGLIFNIQRFSVYDGMGIRTTVFFKGCPLHCSWCHNPESLSLVREIALRSDRCIQCGDCMAICKNGAIYRENGSYVIHRERCLRCGECVDVCVADARALVGREMTVEEVMKEIRADASFFNQSGGGVTFSGGEPLLQHEFLLALLETCRMEGIHTTVDTTGFTSATILKSIAENTDLFLYDLKLFNDAMHREYTGVSNQIIFQNLKLLADWNKKVVIRIPLIPSLNDDEENIRALGAFVASLQKIQEIHLLPYHRSGIDKYQRIGMEYTLVTLAIPNHEMLQSAERMLKQYVPQVIVGG